MATTPPVGSPLSDSPAAQSTPPPGLPDGAAALSNPAAQSNPPPPVQDGGPFSGSSNPFGGGPPVSGQRPGGPLFMGNTAKPKKLAKR